MILLTEPMTLAYNFLLAVFPLLLFLVALFGIFASEGSKLQSDLFFYFQQGLPPVAYQLVVSTLKEIGFKKFRRSRLTFGLLFALYSGSGGMTQLISTLNAAYEVSEGRSF